LPPRSPESRSRLIVRASPPRDRPLMGSSGLLRSVVSEQPRALSDLQAPNPSAVPLRLKSGLFSRGVDPLQSHHVPRLPGALVTPGPAPARFRAPSTTSPGLAPVQRVHPPPAAVPLSGFHSLPAVCQHTRASRPCFMPQTVRGVLPSERCSSLGSRAPLGARSAPLRFSVAVPEVRCSSLILQVSPDGPDLRLARLGSPWSSHVVSDRPEPAFPDALGPLNGTTPFLRLRPLRSLHPRASPRS
jgi:hypothetical protein